MNLNFINKKAFLIILCIFVFIIIWIFVIDRKTNETLNNIITNSLPKEPATEKVDSNKVFTMTKEQRIYKYITEIFNILNDKDYEKAYSLLKDDYKEAEFNEYASFEAYISAYMKDQYNPKYKKFFYSDGLFVVYIELLKSNYTKDDLLNGVSSAFDTITIEEISENNYKFALGKFIFAKNLVPKSISSGNLIATPQKLIRTTDKSTLYFSITNNYSETVTFNMLNTYIETNLTYPAMSGFKTFSIEPGKTENFNITYYFDYESLKKEKYLVIYNFKVNNDLIELKVPIEYAT